MIISIYSDVGGNITNPSTIFIHVLVIRSATLLILLKYQV